MFGSDRIQTYREEGEKSSPVDSYRLSSPECVPGVRERDQRRLKTARAEPEFPSVLKEPQRDTRRDK